MKYHCDQDNKQPVPPKVSSHPISPNLWVSRHLLSVTRKLNSPEPYINVITHSQLLSPGSSHLARLSDFLHYCVSSLFPSLLCCITWYGKSNLSVYHVMGPAIDGLSPCTCAASGLNKLRVLMQALGPDAGFGS